MRLPALARAQENNFLMQNGGFARRSGLDKQSILMDIYSIMKKDTRLTRAKLEALSSAELLEIADEYGIDAPDDLNRQFIIGDLLELASELEAGEKVKETIALSDEEQVINVNTLPAGYNETKINVILRNPISLFVWWDLSDWSIKKIKAERAQLRLSVYFFESLDDEKPADAFDIQLSLSDREQYVIIPSSKKIARVDLISESAGKSDILACSEKIIIPKGSSIMASKPGEKLEVSRIMEHSGVAELLRRHYNRYRQSFD